MKEAFAEVVVPLLSKRSWSESLEFNGAVRHTDYNLSGKVTTWKGGLSWQINDQVRLRGTRSRDIRAPNLAELYTPYQLGLGNIIDPATNVQANTYFITTGNPLLDPEEADTTTFGIVLRAVVGERLAHLRGRLRHQGRGRDHDHQRTEHRQSLLRRCARSVRLDYSRRRYWA